MKAYKTISGDVTNDVLVRKHTDIRISEVSIANTHNSNSCIVSLFATNDDGTNHKYYMVKNLKIPVGATVVIDNKSVGINTKIHNLELTTTGSSSLTIIIS